MAWYVQGGNVVLSPTGLIFSTIANDYYISPTGADTNSGTQGSPWAITSLLLPANSHATTAGKVNYTKLYGNRVLLLDGTYNIGGLVDTTQVNDTEPILNLPSGSSASNTVVKALNRGNAILDGANTAGGGTYHYAPCIGQGDNAGNGASGYVTIDGLKFQNFNGGGANFWYVAHTGTNNICQNCEGTLISTTVQGNNPGMLRGSGNTGGLWTNNKFHDYGNNVETNIGALAAILFYHGINCTYTYNTIYNVQACIHGKGAGAGGPDNYGSTVAYNWLEANAGEASCIKDFSSSQAGQINTFHHNICNGQLALISSGVGSTVSLNAGSQVVYNNTFYFNGGDTSGGFCYVGTSLAGGLTFFNNVLQLTGNTVGFIGEWDIIAGSVGLSDYNCFTNSATASQVLAAGTSGNWMSSPTRYTLANWKTANSSDANSIAADSQLNTPTAGVLSSYQPAAGASIVGAGRVGGLSSGAAVNMGAWDGVVTQIGCSFGTNFPLAGGVFIAGSVQTSFGTPTFQAQLATLGVAVIGLYPGWSSGGYTYSSAPAAVKAINPNIKLVPYTNIMELESGVGSSGSAYSPIFNAATAMKWFLYTAYPNGSITDADGNAQNGLNQTTFTVAGTGAYAGYANYLAWRAFWSGANEYGANWDGLYMDNCFSRPRVTADYNQSGSGQTATAATANWQAGYAAYIPLIRASLPVNSLVFANAADWEVTTIVPTYTGLWDSGAMESIVGGGSSLEKTSWAAMMNLYLITMQNTRNPNFSIFMQDGSVTNYAGMRYGLCSCLLDNAYYYHTNNGNYDTVEAYDELSFNLGLPIAGPNNLLNGTWSSGGISVYQNGVYRRDFQNGIILINPRGNGAQTVTIEVNVWHLRGIQDPATNNAAEVTAGTNISMPDAATAGTGGSGLFLSRTAT